MLAGVVLWSVLTMHQSSATFKTKVTLDSARGYLLALPQGYEEDKSKRWPLLLTT